MEGTSPKPQQVLFLNVPQDQTAFPPTQQGYPAQQGYFPQDEGKNLPPSYYTPPLQQPFPGACTNAVPVTQMQQQAPNVLVIQSQPTPVVARNVVRRISGDHYLTLSIVLTFLCFFLGTWYSLFCTIPAIIFAISARDAEMRGDVEGAQCKARIALILNIISIVFWVIIIVIIVIASSVAATIGSSASYCYYYTRYRSSLGYRYNSGIRYRSNSAIGYRSSYYSYYTYRYYYRTSYYYYYTTTYYGTTFSGYSCSK